MQYSNYVSSLADAFNIEVEDVLFALLASSGAEYGESYAMIFRRSHLPDKKINEESKKILRSKPGIARLISHLQRKKTPTHKDVLTDDQQPSHKKNRGWDENLTDTENLEKIIRDEIPKLEGKDKISTAVSFVKLRGVDVEKKERLIFYLPLRCDMCEYRENANK